MRLAMSVDIYKLVSCVIVLTQRMILQFSPISSLVTPQVSGIESNLFKWDKDAKPRGYFLAFLPTEKET